MAFLAARPMEDFFIHPTFDMDDAGAPSSTIPDDFGLYHALPQHTLRRSPATHRPSKSLPRSTTMASLKQTPTSTAYAVEQPDYFHGYVSDEEVASPADVDDTLSFHSSDLGRESVGGSIIITPGSYLAEAVHHCSRAQAVTIQPVGKPRVIDLPKLDLSYRRTSRPSSSFNEGRRGSRLRSIDEAHSNRSSQDSHSRDASSDSSTANSPASTAPSSLDEEEPVHRHNKIGSLRHMPLLEAARAITPTESFEVRKSATFPRRSIDPVARHSADLSDRFHTPISPTASFRPTIRKMGKFSSIINLSLLGRDSKDHCDAQSLYSVQESDTQGVSQNVSPHHAPARRSSTQGRKLVARGANERAPTMTLPPFPGE